MQIFIIYRDRLAGMIPVQIRNLYENIFSSMTNWEFLNFWYHGKLHLADKETLITISSTQYDLMLILNGHATFMWYGNNITSITRWQLIKEDSYSAGKPVLADVISKKGLTLLYLESQCFLNKPRKSKLDAMEKIDRILTPDMAGKLIR